MTSTLVLTPAEHADADTRGTSARWLVMESAAALLALLGFAYTVLHSGGRDRGATFVAVLLAAPCVLLSRPWSRVPVFEQVLCAAVAGAAVLVPFLTTLGVSEARDLDVYIYAPVLYLAMRGFATDTARRRLVVVALFAVGAFEASKVWPVWVGENDRSYRIVGTFYWHNQFGVFMAAIALLAIAHALRGAAPERYFAMALASVATALCVLSHSRGAEMALAAGMLVLCAVMLRQRPLRCIVGIGAIAVGAVLVAGLMLADVAGHHGVAYTAPSLASTSLGSSSSYRAQFITSAAKVFVHDPLVSHGFGSFAHLSGQYLPSGAEETTWVHSAPFQALTDGGLVLGIPVIVATIALASRWLQLAARSFRLPDRAGAAEMAAAATGIALLIHACIDFDSQYPTLVAMIAVVGALAAPRAEPAVTAKHAITSWTLLVATTASTILGLTLVSQYWTTSTAVAAARVELSSGDARDAVTAMTPELQQFAPDPRPAIVVVTAAQEGLRVPAPTLRRALAESRGYRHLDSTFRRVWARAESAEATGQTN